MTCLTVPAPAKINLFLHIVGRRADGYHQLESVFALIDLADQITLTLTDDGSIRRTHGVPGVPEEHDLTVRAARALQQAARVNQGVALAVSKKIPMGGGLGGGSSDCASVLLALNRLWRVGWSQDRIAGLAVSLGADVPFFIGGEPALVTGIGERLRPVSLPKMWVALAMPPVLVPTGEIFSDKNLTRDTLSEKIAAFATTHGHNDMESVVRRRYPLVEQTLLRLRRHTEYARMTGSGACVFGLFEQEEAARRALADLPESVTGMVSSTLTRHPLVKWSLRVSCCERLLGSRQVG